MVDLHHAPDQKPHRCAHQKPHVDVIAYLLAVQVVCVRRRPRPVLAEQVVQVLRRLLESVPAFVLAKALLEPDHLQPPHKLLLVVKVQQDVRLLERLHAFHLLHELDALEHLVARLVVPLIRVKLFVPQEVDHDDEDADVPRVQRPHPLVLASALHPKVLQAEPPEVLVPVQRLAAFPLVQPHRVVQQLVARVSVEAAEHSAQHLSGRKPGIRAGFEVQLELLGPDRVQLRVDVDEEELQPLFDLLLGFFYLLVYSDRPLPFNFFLVFVEGHDCGYFCDCTTFNLV